MTGSAKRENSLHVRLTDEAHALLGLLSAANGKELNALASELLERALMGEGHVLKVAAQRFVRSGLIGTDRDFQR